MQRETLIKKRFILSTIAEVIRRSIRQIDKELSPETEENKNQLKTKDFVYQEK